MTVQTLAILAGVLAGGCQKASTLEQFAAAVKSAKSIRMVGTAKSQGQTRPITILRQAPNRASTVSKNLIATVNERAGIVELDIETKKYFTYPWMGKFSPIAGKVFPEKLASCLPAYGASPLSFAPAHSWKLKKSGPNDVWSIEIESPQGKRVVEIELSQDGKLTRYLADGVEFVVTTWEIDPVLKDSDFQTMIPDGTVSSELPLETMTLQVGSKLVLENFEKRTNGLKSGGWALVVFVDPEDGIYPKMKPWLSKSNPKFQTLQVSLSSGGDYGAKDSAHFWQLVSATPTMALLDKTGNIRALWQGFDETQTAKLDQEIHKAITENN